MDGARFPTVGKRAPKRRRSETSKSGVFPARGGHGTPPHPSPPRALWAHIVPIGGIGPQKTAPYRLFNLEYDLVSCGFVIEIEDNRPFFAALIARSLLRLPSQESPLSGIAVTTNSCGSSSATSDDLLPDAPRRTSLVVEGGTRHAIGVGIRTLAGRKGAGRIDVLSAVRTGLEIRLPSTPVHGRCALPYDTPCPRRKGAGFTARSRRPQTDKKRCNRGDRAKGPSHGLEEDAGCTYDPMSKTMRPSYALG